MMWYLTPLSELNSFWQRRQRYLPTEWSPCKDTEPTGSPKAEPKAPRASKFRVLQACRAQPVPDFGAPALPPAAAALRRPRVGPNAPVPSLSAEL